MFQGGPLDPGRIYSVKLRNPTADFIPRGTIVVKGRRVLGIVTDDPGLPQHNVMLQVFGDGWARLGPDYGPVRPRQRLSFGWTTGPTREDGLTPVFVNLLSHNSATGLVG